MFGALGRRAPALGLLPGGAGGLVPLIGAGWLHPALAFSRASAAAIIRNATPPLTEVGNTVPRFDPDLGLLIEGQRTNLEANPRTLGRTGWTTLGLSSAVSSAGPNGVSGDATTVTETLTTSTHEALSGNVVLIAATPYSVSFLVRAGTCVNVQAVGRSAGFGTNAWANFQLSGAGAVGSIGSSVTRASIVRYGDWYLCSFTAPATASGASGISLMMGQSLTDGRGPFFTGTGRDVTFGPVWIEQAEFSTTPPLPAVSGQATRLADSLSVPLSSLGIGPNGVCTLVGTFMLPQQAAGIGQCLFCIDDGTTTNRRYVGNEPSAQTVVGFGSAADTITAGAILLGVPFRIAAAFRSDGTFSLSLNGAPAVAANSSAALTGQTTLRAGNSSSGNPALNGYAKRLSYLPRPTADADLPALSLRGNADLTSMQEIIQWP